jgi:hypothetical protein
MTPNFEEKQYESAANAELSLSDPAVYSPGQVAEAILGFDAAARQLPMAVWTVLQMGTPPGVLLVPNFWNGAPRQPIDINLPSFHVSVLFQYKRPQFMFRSNAAQFAHWQAPYYRFEIDPNQHEVLKTLETNLGTRALVRYASPAFHEYTVLEQRLLARQILPSSAFVSPLAINGTHSIWSYQTPGTAGYANPDPEKIDSEDYITVVRVRRERARRESLLAHLRGLAESMRIPRFPGTAERVPEQLGSLFAPNARDLVESAPNVRDRIEGLWDLFRIGDRIGPTGAAWWIAQFSA